MAIPLSLSMLPSDIRKLIVREYLDGPSKMLMRSVSRYFRDLIVLPKGRCSFGVDICAVAARQGWLLVLQFALSQGAQLSVHLCAEAAAGGQLLALQFLHSKSCPWDARTCMYAARHGHLELLQWAHEAGCPWDGAIVCRAAARGGHLAVLQWAKANGCAWTADTCAAAAMGGHLSVLRWAHENGCPWDESTCAAAARGGHLELLQWAIRENAPRDLETEGQAAEEGHLTLINWLISTGDPIEEELVPGRAAYGGHIHLLEWALRREVPLEPDTWLYAASEGRLPLLQWAHEKELISPDEEIASAALEKGHFSVIKWAHEHGYKPAAKVCYYAAARGDLETLKWAREKGYSMDAELYFLAASSGNLELVQWLHENGVPRTRCRCVISAANFAVLESTAEKGRWSDELLHEIACAEHFSLIKWLQHHCGSAGLPLCAINAANATIRESLFLAEDFFCYKYHNRFVACYWQRQFDKEPEKRQLSGPLGSEEPTSWDMLCPADVETLQAFLAHGETLIHNYKVTLLRVPSCEIENASTPKMAPTRMAGKRTMLNQVNQGSFGAGSRPSGLRLVAKAKLAHSLLQNRLPSSHWRVIEAAERRLLL